MATTAQPAGHAHHAGHTSHASHTSHAGHTSHASHAGHTRHASHASHTSHTSHASHAGHEHHDHAAAPGHHAGPSAPSLTRVAFMATVHCLTGCAIGEVAGMVIGTALGWGNLETMALAIVLAFGFGYALTAMPLLRSGFTPMAAARLALAADTASILLMEIVDNALMWFIPGAMDAPLNSALFWLALAGSLLVAGLFAWPLNRWLIARGRGHAVVHAHH